MAAGLARHLGVKPLWVRIAFVVLLQFGGLGALLYAVFWAVLPVGSDAPPDRRDRNIGQLVALGAMTLGTLVFFHNIGWGSGWIAVSWLLAIVVAGAGLIWHQADPNQRQRWSKAAADGAWLAPLTTSDRRGLALRLSAGGGLIVAGIVGVAIVASPGFGVGAKLVLISLAFTLVTVAGIGLVFAPLFWRLFTELRTEQAGRIREQERAELAAMVHDQVLHTLALIQRNAGDTETVQRLTRGQERKLRNWLYKPSGSPNERLGAAMEEAAAEIEEHFPVSVDSVVVGDCAVNDGVRALVAATREALVNAAKHAGVPSVSLYAEVESSSVSVFVRDRGKGFSPDLVDDDRHGVRGSIIGRMERHGGTAAVRSTPGEGTEVRLSMPLPASGENDE